MPVSRGGGASKGEEGGGRRRIVRRGRGEEGVRADFSSPAHAVFSKVQIVLFTYINFAKFRIVSPRTTY